jgi:two-component system LytT family sensor kinase
MNDFRSKTLPFVRLFLAHPPYWACQAGGWTGIWIITLLHLLTEPEHNYKSISSLHSVVLFLSLAAFSHFYRLFIKMNHWCALKWRRLLPRAIAGALVIAIAHALIVSMIFSGDLARITVREIFPLAHVALFALGNLVLISVWSAVYFGYHFQVDFQKMQVNQLQLQVALREAEHRALSAQVNPHFLFNSLNTVRALIDENPDKAREAITQLARVFRASLNTSRKDLITLREEMDTVRSYLSLEKARFEDRLIIRDDVPDDVLESRLPPFLLQTLIENAIKYGIGNKRSSEISYRAFLNANGLNLQVTNPGKLLPLPQSTSSPRNATTGLGLENSRLRLQLLFGAHGFLHLTSLSDSVVQAEALIPQFKLAL